MPTELKKNPWQGAFGGIYGSYGWITLGNSELVTPEKRSTLVKNLMKVCLGIFKQKVGQTFKMNPDQDPAGYARAATTVLSRGVMSDKMSGVDAVFHKCHNEKGTGESDTTLIEEMIIRLSNIFYEKEDASIERCAICSSSAGFIFQAASYLTFGKDDFRKLLNIVPNFCSPTDYLFLLNPDIYGNTWVNRNLIPLHNYNDEGGNIVSSCSGQDYGKCVNSLFIERLPEADLDEDEEEEAKDKFDKFFNFMQPIFKSETKVTIKMFKLLEDQINYNSDRKYRDVLTNLEKIKTETLKYIKETDRIDQEPLNINESMNFPRSLIFDNKTIVEHKKSLKSYSDTNPGEFFIAAQSLKQVRNIIENVPRSVNIPDDDDLHRQAILISDKHIDEMDDIRPF